MDVRISRLTTEALRDAVNTECKRTLGKKNPKPLSSKTVQNEYGLISAVLNLYAPGLDISVKLPQVEHNQHELSTPDVIFNLVKGTEMELPVLLAMWLSFTASEIRGLTKLNSISSDGNYITIKEVIVMNEHGEDVVKNKGKQPTRDRTLRIPEYIKTLISNIETDRIVPLTADALSKKWSRLVRHAGIPHMTFHDLRHVSASVMTLLRIPDKYAQDRGGWKSDKIMKSRYMQTFSDEREEIDRRIDDYMYDCLFSNAEERRRDKKYRCWLELFDRSDMDESKKILKNSVKKTKYKYESATRNTTRKFKTPGLRAF